MSIQAQIQNGRVVTFDPIPMDWEGRTVTVSAATPDDPMTDVAKRLAALHALGPMEYEPGERQCIDAALADLDAASKKEMRELARLPS